MATGTPQVRVELKHTKTQLPDGSWKLTVWATVQRGREMQEGETLDFFQDGRFLGQKDTDPYGNTEPIECSLPAGTANSIIEARRTIGTNTAIYQRSVDLAKITSSLLPDELNVNAVGENGKYAIVGSITSSAKLPLRGLKVRIFDKRKGTVTPVREETTDAYGDWMGFDLPPFTDPTRAFLFEVVGTQLGIQELVLAGIPTGGLPVEVPDLATRLTPEQLELYDKPYTYWFRSVSLSLRTLFTHMGRRNT